MTLMDWWQAVTAVLVLVLAITRLASKPTVRNRTPYAGGFLCVGAILIAFAGLLRWLLAHTATSHAEDRFFWVNNPGTAGVYWAVDGLVFLLTAATTVLVVLTITVGAGELIGSRRRAS